MLMTIKKGDKVKAYWNSTTGAGLAELEGEVLHMPSDTGDMIYLKDKDGNTHAINPNSSSFEGLVKEAG